MPTLRHLPIKGGTLIAKTDSMYQGGDWVDYLIDLETAKGPMPKGYVSARQRGKIAYYDELGKSGKYNGDPNVPIGKRVY